LASSLSLNEETFLLNYRAYQNIGQADVVSRLMQTYPTVLRDKITLELKMGTTFVRKPEYMKNGNF
jgi:hypothetical protein